MIIAVDFDGTIVSHRYPEIGKEKPNAIRTLCKLAAEGHRIILWTAREGALLEEAVEFCKQRGLYFYAVNSDTPAGGLSFSGKTSSTKLVADIYIDDCNLGGLPDWNQIYELVHGKRRSSRRKCSLKKLFGR